MAAINEECWIVVGYCKSAQSNKYDSLEKALYMKVFFGGSEEQCRIYLVDHAGGDNYMEARPIVSFERLLAATDPDRAHVLRR